MSFHGFRPFQPFGRTIVAGPAFDADAAGYFARIAIAGSTISEANKAAVNAFVVGCKADGIWSAIKASCILAGADTLSGALVPLVGIAPTNFNFVSGDYSRTVGLTGNGSTKYLASNRMTNDDPQNDCSKGVFVSSAGSGITRRFCGRSGSTFYECLGGETGVPNPRFRCRSGTIVALASAAGVGLIGMSRDSAAAFKARAWGNQQTFSILSESAVDAQNLVFSGVSTTFSSDMTAQFYWIGSSLDLALIDGRLTTLMGSLT